MVKKINIKGRKRPVFTYFGGKSIHLNKLLPLIPKHGFYGEVFGGAASLLFYKEPAQLEVYNDLDSNLVNFFRVLRDEEKFEKFYLKIQLTPYSREEHRFCKKRLEETIDEIEKARRMFYLFVSSFGGQGGWSYAKKEAKKSHAVREYLGRIDLLPEFHKRFRMVQVEHLDFMDFLKKYNVWGKEGFFYLDPPYYPSKIKTKRSYKFLMSVNDHWNMIKWLIEDCKVKILLSGYDNNMYNLLLEKGWRKEEWKGRIHTTAGQKEQKKIECVWFNYDI